jgi:catechol 2,3-dioxygenase-like lactoylglutathione lyase family enzyme
MYKDQITTVLDGSRREKMIHFYRDLMKYPVIDEGTQGGDAVFAAAKTGRVKISSTPLPYAVGPTCMWIEAAWVDGTYAEIIKSGEVEYQVEPKDTYYHARSGFVGDPNGNTSCIINYEKDYEARRAAGLKNGWYADEYRSVFYLKNIKLCHEFYTGVLGFKEVYSWKEHAGDRGFKYELCEGGSSYLEILFREPFVRTRLGMVELVSKDINKLWQTVSARSGELVTAPPSGNDRSFSVADPDGNIIRICAE